MEISKNKANGNIIKKWLENKGVHSRDCGVFIAVDSTSKEWGSKFLEVVKKQFPNNNSYINDVSIEMFIVIEK